MKKIYPDTCGFFFTSLFLLLFFSNNTEAQQCIAPAKKIVLFDPAGNYYVYWKPVTPPTVINYLVQVKCTSLPPCFSTVTVNSANVIKMNGGWLGCHIPPLPATNSQVTTSIFPPNCPPVFSFTFVTALDLISDNLDIATASCDSNECEIFVNSYKTLKNLNNYTSAKCGGLGAAVAASTVTCLDAPIRISLKKNAAGKWQMKTMDTVQCDSCYTFNFQVTCPNGSIFYVQDVICFNYTGPDIGCREATALKDLPVSIFPNPAGDKCNLQFTLDNPGSISLVIYNALGKKVRTVYSNEEFDEGQHDLELSLSDLSTGMYIVELRTSDIFKRMKLLKF